MKKNKLHPAWMMLFACCCIQFGGTGILSNSVGIFMPPVCAELGFTTAQYSMHLSVKGIVMMLCLPLAGRLIPKIPPRILLTGAALLGAGALAASATFHQLYQWYIAGVLYGIAGGFLFMTMSPILLNHWFKAKNGFAIGIALACSGLGGAVMNPVGTFFINSFGWRTAAFLMALISMLFMVPCTLFILRVYPSDLGVAPYGAPDMPEEQLVQPPQETPKADEKPGFFREPIFYLLFLTALAISFPVVFNNHFPQYAISIGLSNVVGASMSSCCMIGNITGKLGLGWVNDRISTRNSVLLGGCVVLVGFFLILFGGGSPLQLLIGATCFGVCMSLTAVAIPLIVKDMFDAQSYTMALSYITMASSLVSGVGVGLVGYLFDLFGSYQKCFMLAVVIYFAMLLLVCFCYKKRQLQSYAALGSSAAAVK